MNTIRLTLVFLFVAATTACSDRPQSSDITPVSENACNVSCGFDHTKNRACLEDPLVMDYAINSLLRPLLTDIRPILEQNPQGACFCDNAILDESGKFTSVVVAQSTSESMSSAVRNAILESDVVPVPLGVECIVGIDFPLSFNN